MSRSTGSTRSCLPVRHGGLAGGILPDPDAPGRRAVIAKTLHGCGAIIGTTVPPAQLPSSVRVAEAGARLPQAGVLRGDPVFVADHYDTIMVVRDPWLLEHLRAQALAPLAGRPAGHPAAARGDPRRLAHRDGQPAGNRTRAACPSADRALSAGPAAGRLRGRLDDPDNQRRLMLAVCWA